MEAVLFDDKPRTGAGRAVLLQTLAQRLYDAGVAGVPRTLLEQEADGASQRWAGELLKDWKLRVAG